MERFFSTSRIEMEKEEIMHITNKTIGILFLSAIIVISLLISGSYAGQGLVKKSNSPIKSMISDNDISAYRHWEQNSGRTSWQLEQRNHVNNIRSVGKSSY